MPKRRTIKGEQLEKAMQEIFDEVTEVGNQAALTGVQEGLRVGANLWRKDARDSIGRHTYWRSGEKHETGMYARSITRHMLDKSETRPRGEVGSRKMGGLSHLLEDGHARIGGGKVKGVLHIEEQVRPAAYEAAIEATKRAIEDGFQ